MAVEKYNSQNAVDYAIKWAMQRNPEYFNFDNFGGDCTNFVSQCLFAGSRQMNYNSPLGWFYVNSSSRTASWTGVNFFYDFLTANTGLGPFGKVYPLDSARVGDFIQLQNYRNEFYHSLIITKIYNGNVFVSAHSFDALNRPLDDYNFNNLRLIKIDGVRK